MIRIYPAIDLIDGKVVRLERGDYGKKTEYSDNPTAVAEQFSVSGSEYIHIVDLDGAKAGRPVNVEAIKSISTAVKTPIQVGGGVRSVKSAEELLKYVKRVIIGTAAITETELLKKLINTFGSKKIIVSVDYKNGVPAVNGWLDNVPLETNRLQADLLEAGVSTVIITDVNRDGLMRGPNIKLAKEWKKTGFEVICAGGITSLQNIRDLKAAGIDGAIIGKALYENKINLKEAINAD